jgi:ABC-2 type transport system ATP-binding protein
MILDEPTVGVDPQSRNQILESIETMGGQGLSVLYTTHYMEEAERLCDRVGIIDAGKIVAEGTRRELVAIVGAHDRVRVSVSGDGAAFAARCRTIAGVVEVHQTDSEVDIVTDDAGRVLARIVEAAELDGVSVTGVEVREPDLETVFLHLTGKALRD